MLSKTHPRAFPKVFPKVMGKVGLCPPVSAKKSGVLKFYDDFMSATQVHLTNHLPDISIIGNGTYPWSASVDYLDVAASYGGYVFYGGRGNTWHFLNLTTSNFTAIELTATLLVATTWEFAVGWKGAEDYATGHKWSLRYTDTNLILLEDNSVIRLAETLAQVVGPYTFRVNFSGTVAGFVINGAPAFGGSTYDTAASKGNCVTVMCPVSESYGYLNSLKIWA